MKPSKTTHADPARAILAAAIGAKAEAERKVEATRDAVEKASEHWHDLFRKAEAAREALAGDLVERREMAELADAIAGGLGFAPNPSLRMRLTAEADAAEEEARLASQTRDKFEAVLRTFEAEAVNASKKLDEAIGGVMAARVEAMLEEAIELTKALQEKRHFLNSHVLWNYMAIGSPLRNRLRNFADVVNFVEVPELVAAPEIARWAQAAEALATDPNAPLPSRDAA